MTFPIFHDGPLCPSGHSSLEDRLSDLHLKRQFYTSNGRAFSIPLPLYPELKSMVSKVMGIDRVIDSIVIRLGELERAYLIDVYAEGKDTGIIDLLLVGNVD